MKFKNKVCDLKVFGGPAVFSNPLYVGRPNIPSIDRFIERVKDILEKRWLTNNGPYVREFEKRMEKYLGVSHCIAVTNATIGLEIAARALGLSGEVIVPSFTFIATAHCLQWQGITPAFCDVDLSSHNIDSNMIEKAINPKTTGILAVHTWGRPCQVEKLEKIAKKWKIKLLFDAAHAFGCSHKGKMIGGFGNAEVFSFHATKFLNTFEGGCVTTNDERVAEKIRLMKNFGFRGYDNVIFLGTNGKMSEVSAAMGLSSLEEIESIIDNNRKNYLQYKKELSNIHGVKMVLFNEKESSNYQYIVIEIDESNAGISRDRIISILHSENVLARRYFFPGCHNMEPYKTQQPNAGEYLLNTERISKKVMVLPTGKEVKTSDISKICHLINFVIKNSTEIKLKMKEKGMS